MLGEEYITKTDKKKQQITKKLLKNVFVCAMKRTTWGSTNTPSLSIVALRRPKEREIFQSHKFMEGAFVDIRQKIKQEKSDGDGTNSPPAKKRKTAKKSPASRSQEDVISVSDDSDSPDYNPSHSSSSDDDESSDGDEGSDGDGDAEDSHQDNDCDDSDADGDDTDGACSDNESSNHSDDDFVVDDC